jgi:DNA-binding CsgD family transcriptional regulator
MGGVERSAYPRTMAFDTQAALAREAVSKLADDHLDPQELLREAGARIRRVVPHDLGGWMTLDPDTLLPTGNIRSGKSPALVEAFWRNELLTPDLHKFTELSRRRFPVATMSTVDVAAVDVSPRRQLIHQPAGLGDEARVVFRANGSTWGAACLHRESSTRDFDAEERAFLTEIAGDLGRALQRSLSRRPATGALPAAPGVVTLDAELRVVSATAVAEQLVGLFPGDPSSTLFGVAARVHDRRDSARARVRLTDGRWLLLHAAHLCSGSEEPDRVAVILEPAPRGDVMSLVLRLHGLSAREREVAHLLLTGLPTAELAARLFISRHTLRDHVKAIFAKVGASSRAELMAMVADTATP